jgi:UMF1 family MFS transporter
VPAAPDAPSPPPPRPSLTARLGLGRPELRAWALYDWANSVFMTIMILVYPIYFIQVAAADLAPVVATARIAFATAAAMTITALISPVLGAMADHAGIKKRMLALFLGLGAVSTAALYLVGRGQWAAGAALFMLGNIGVSASIVFYESLLPHIARQDEVDRVSMAGYAAGYLGGGLPLIAALIVIQNPDAFRIPDAATAMRLAFVGTAVWWVAFSIPLFRTVPEPPRAPHAADEAGRTLVTVAFKRLRHTLRELRRYRQAFLFLIAFLLYNDGVNTIIRMASSYGTEIGIPRGPLIAAFVLVQFVGIPFSFLFGALAGRIGAKRAIFVCLAVYFVIAVWGYYMKTTFQFFVLAFLVGMVQGGAQGLGRSVFSTMIPRHRSSEFFAFFSVFEKFAGIFGPAIFGIMAMATGSSRNAILSLILFFIAGGALLAFVDVEEGQRAAREAESAAGA